VASGLGPGTRRIADIVAAGRVFAHVTDSGQSAI
jgi:hypothetical protein